MSKRVLDFYASKSWAILEANLQEMYEIYKAAIERKALDNEFDPEAVAAKIGRPLDNTRTVTVRDRVAVLPVTGPIMRYANIFTEISGATSIELLAKDFTSAINDPSVKAVVLDINSPGGEVDGTSELAQMIFNARGEKPITAYIGNLGASAAYWLASACDEVVCADTASLGSIGVVGGVRTSKDKNLIEFVSSQSPNKRPDPQTESGRAQFQAHVDALADVFIETVARNRNMTTDDVVNNGGAGGLKVGRLAVESGLADRVGTLEEVISDLAAVDLASWKPRQNLKAETVIHTESKLLTEGAKDMADEQKPAETKTDASKSDIDKAELDKSIGERISAFFHEKFGASSDAPATIKADERVDTHAAEIERLKGETSEAKAEAVLAKQKIAVLEKDARATRFTSLAENWPGETSKHVAMLELLATTVEGGEESEAYKGYVTQQSAIAEQMKTAKLFEEVGSSAPAEGSVAAQIDAQVKVLMDADAKLTKEQAFDKIWTGLSPASRAQYRAEERVN